MTRAQWLEWMRWGVVCGLLGGVGLWVARWFAHPEAEEGALWPRNPRAVLAWGALALWSLCVWGEATRAIMLAEQVTATVHAVERRIAMWTPFEAEETGGGTPKSSIMCIGSAATGAAIAPWPSTTMLEALQERVTTLECQEARRLGSLRRIRAYCPQSIIEREVSWRSSAQVHGRR